MTHSTCDTCGAGLHMLLPRVIDPQSREAFAVAVCPDCDAGRTAPVPADLGPYYAAQYFGGRHGVTERLCMGRRVRRLGQVAAPGRVLDFGCGDGGFMLAARQAGWDVTGVEMIPAQARARGLAVAETIAEVEGPFDAITLWHSLEHVVSPRRTLTELAAKLREDGVLLVAVPNRRSWQARAFGSRWFHYDVPRHVSHFTPRALEALFVCCGLQPVRRWNLEVEIDWFGWPQSLLNMLMPTPNVLFDVVTRRKITHQPGEVALSLAVGAVATGLSAPLVPLAAAAGQGAILTMAARKSGGT